MTDALCWLDTNQRVAFLHKLAALGHNSAHNAPDLGLDFVEDLHRLYDADGLAGLKVLNL